MSPPIVRGVIRASDEWGANCGPVALAGALGLTLDAVRPLVETDGRFKGYMGVRDIRRAIAASGAKIVRQWPNVVTRADAMFHLPGRLRDAAEAREVGSDPLVVMLRYHGPWDGTRGEAVHRHLVCYRHDLYAHSDPAYRRLNGCGSVLDCNNLTTEGDAFWLPPRVWARRALLDIMPKRATGDVSIQWMGQVRSCP